MKKKNLHKPGAVALSCMLLAGSVLAGCSGGGKEGNQPAGSASPAAPAKEVSYPASLVYWSALNGNVSATMKSNNEIAAYKKLEEITGTKVEFQHPPTGQEKDAFNLMVASNKLPDVVEYNWINVPAGPDKAIKDKTIIRLNELIEQHAPNLSKLLKEKPEIRKMITTDEGNIFVFPFIRGDEYLMTYNGLGIRKDWLDKLGLAVPETIDDWYTVLKAFKEKDPNGNGKADEIPLLIDDKNVELAFNNPFIGAWGITFDFYQENGKVKYGPMQPQFKEFLATMAKWYKEGLIDKDYVSTDNKLKDAKVTNDQLGALTLYSGSGIGKYIPMMTPKNPQFKLVGVPSAVLKKGEKPQIGQKEAAFTGIGAAVTGTNKNPAETVKWLDYKYGQEGHMLFNFGIEGESYKMVNNYPTYTDKIMKNPNNLPIAQAMAQYALASFSGPFVQDRRYMEQFAVLPEQKEAIDVWMKASNEKLLPFTSPTAEESTRFASIMNDVNTQFDEVFNRIIMGAESIDGYDKFISRIQSMGIEEAIKLKQAALDRYNSRK